MVIAGAGDDFLPGALRALKWLVYKTGARIILSTVSSAQPRCVVPFELG